MSDDPIFQDLRREMLMDEQAFVVEAPYERVVTVEEAEELLRVYAVEADKDLPFVKGREVE